MLKTRRGFLRDSAAMSVGLLAASASSLNAAPSSDRLSVGFIGCGGRANNLATGFGSRVRVAWACDPDQDRLQGFKESFGAEQTTKDLRRVLDDKSVDAVVIATPDHWHAPAAIMACNAGKHVYVEKPWSHNYRESCLLLEAAQRNQVTVQHGTQSRSNPKIMEAIRLLRHGQIGEVLMAKAWNVQRRRNIGHASPSEPPAQVDYDAWVGPAEWMPFQSNRFHYDWHWWYNFGTGDVGNDGTHELDIARWGLDVHGLPNAVNAVGGKFYFDDDQQFPDTATCAFQWETSDTKLGRRQLVFEMRIWSKNLPYNCDTGIEFMGSQGMLFVSKRGKLQVWDDQNRQVELPKLNEQPTVAENHQVDFLESIIEGRVPTASAEVAHDSVSLVHLANIALRVGTSLNVDPGTSTIGGDDQVRQLVGRTYRDGGHWAVPADV